MALELPQVLQAFLKAQNDHDTNALVACFNPDAIVQDEGLEHRGTDAIRAWSDDVIERYQLGSEVREVGQQGEEVRVTALVTGNFDGSPAELTYFFTLREGKITRFRAE